uniref:Uncharacterized protein n=1 Tax=Romanomermis culicivorax TaxID=13658 RepID=A0A915KGQ9_ROMCU
MPVVNQKLSRLKDTKRDMAPPTNQDCALENAGDYTNDVDKKLKSIKLKKEENPKFKCRAQSRISFREELRNNLTECQSAEQWTTISDYPLVHQGGINKLSPPLALLRSYSTKKPLCPPLLRGYAPKNEQHCTFVGVVVTGL